MKTILSLLLIATSALADQKLIVVQCKDGQAQAGALETALRQGWRVVSAVGVTDSDSVSAWGKPKQAFTASIVYVVEKDAAGEPTVATVDPFAEQKRIRREQLQKQSPEK